jgi:serine protease
MNWLLVIAAIWPRPECPPVGAAELRLAAQREAALARAGCVLPSSAWEAGARDRVPGRFVVGFEAGALTQAEQWVAGLGGKVVWQDETGAGFIAAEFPLDAAHADGELRSSARQAPKIRYFEPDLRVRAATIPNDPYFRSYQWDKWVMYADLAWDLEGTGQVKVGVVDNGVDYEHPDLAGSFQLGELGYDFIGDDNDPRPDNPGISEAFHGTHVAGIIAAARNNNLGVAGWSQVRLLAVRVLDDSGLGNTSVLASGIRWAASNGCRVINMSLGAASAATPVTEACQYAVSVNALLVAASGNEGQGSINHPAALDDCIAVGWMSKDSRLSAYSNYGPEQELVAPGSDVLSTVPGGSYEPASGTSMATPEVSGVAALVLSTDTSVSATHLRAILDASAIEMDGTGRDQTYGYGLLNARRAMDLAGLTRRVGCSSAQPSDVRASIVRGEVVLPGWVEKATVFDATGRMVFSGAPRTGRKLNLGPGAYFARLEAAGRAQTEKVLILR